MNRKPAKKRGAYSKEQASKASMGCTSMTWLRPGNLSHPVLLPTPKSVAQDIHKHLPSLTRKSTVFRASQATIDQRQAELVAFLGALSSEDMPTLVQEIRASNIVSDFFGCWQRDFEHAEEYGKAPSVRRNSLTRSVISFQFSTSHSSVTSSPNSVKKRYQRSQLSTTRRLSSTSLSEIPEEPKFPCSFNFVCFLRSLRKYLRHQLGLLE